MSRTVTSLPRPSYSEGVDLMTGALWRLAEVPKLVRFERFLRLGLGPVGGSNAPSVRVCVYDMGNRLVAYDTRGAGLMVEGDRLRYYADLDPLPCGTYRLAWARMDLQEVTPKSCFLEKGVTLDAAPVEPSAPSIPEKMRPSWDALQTITQGQAGIIPTCPTTPQDCPTTPPVPVASPSFTSVDADARYLRYDAQQNNLTLEQQVQALSNLGIVFADGRVTFPGGSFIYLNAP